MNNFSKLACTCCAPFSLLCSPFVEFLHGSLFRCYCFFSFWLCFHYHVTFLTRENCCLVYVLFGRVLWPQGCHHTAVKGTKTILISSVCQALKKWLTLSTITCNSPDTWNSLKFNVVLGNIDLSKLEGGLLFLNPIEQWVFWGVNYPPM